MLLMFFVFCVIVVVVTGVGVADVVMSDARYDVVRIYDIVVEVVVLVVVGVVCAGCVVVVVVVIVAGFDVIGVGVCGGCYGCCVIDVAGCVGVDFAVAVDYIVVLLFGVGVIWCRCLHCLCYRCCCLLY